MNLDAYRTEAEEFHAELDLEYYLHYSGQKDEFEIEPVYERHTRLFTREAVDGLREAGNPKLLEFAVQGLIGRETKAQEAELARREAALEVEVDGERMPFRAAPVAQANESDPERRVAIEAARNELIESELNPLLRELLERSHALAGELGFGSYLSMCEELAGIDLAALAGETAAFLEGTDSSYQPLVEPWLVDQLEIDFDSLRRSDLAAFFRAPGLDAHFPAERLISDLEATLAGLGIDLRAQTNVILDAEQRPKKTPRAFCAAVRVPDEIYLMIAPTGGRYDYESLFHEAGHTEHFAHADRSLPVEDRYMGDNSVTECFAFLLEHLVSSPEWLRRRLGIEEPEPVVGYQRAAKLVMLRRYSAKLAYELALHDDGARDELADVYVRHLSQAVRVDWPRSNWLIDVDPFFYAGRYLRAWSLETHVRRLLVERFGEAWFEQPAAGDFLRDLWRRGQRDGADELLGELTGERLEFSALSEEMASA